MRTILIALMLTVATAAAGQEMTADELRERAESGDADAQYELGSAYLSGGLGLADDGTEAVAWLRLAAEQGDVRAESLLGGIYSAGWAGVEADQVEAVSWYRRAAKQGDTWPQKYLGDAYQ